MPLTWLWVVLGVLGGVLLLLGAGYALLRHRGALPALFRPRAAVIVHNPLVQRPVVVRCEALDMAALRRDAPELAAFVDDLPPGKGVERGGPGVLVVPKEVYPNPSR